MQGYFDIHNHILPGVDDGAEDMDETRRMLLIAYEEGIRCIVATPHFVAGRSNISVAKLIDICGEVNRIAESLAEEFHVLLGNELFYSTEMIEALKRGDALTIAGTRYVLVEFLIDSSYKEIRNGLSNCIYAGYIPILAHAERYHCLVKTPSLVDKLIKHGVYIQINFHYIRGGYFDSKVRFCHRLLKNNQVHFLGTDAHGAYQRIPRAKDSINYLKKKYSESTVKQLLWDNPMTLLKNKHINM
jgi:protein-tyrosine phosphatase